jgi:RNA polymerase sigma factor (TIGR02999 family)
MRNPKESDTLQRDKITESKRRSRMDSQSELLARLLQSWSQGREGAIDKLVPLVYDDLRRLAHRYMSDERPGHTLQTTALVNEAYLRLAGSAQATREDRIHFFAACSRSMRQILVDSARSRQAVKRGGEMPRVELQEALAAAGQPGADLVAIDDALNALAVIDPRKSQVVELRFFGGLSVQETAEVLKVSVATVHRDWRLAKSWLRRELSREQAHGG